MCFNSRAREGRDMCARSGRAEATCFNSRAREGRDYSGSSAPILDTLCFNSRAREGRDSFAP